MQRKYCVPPSKCENWKGNTVKNSERLHWKLLPKANKILILNKKTLWKLSNTKREIYGIIFWKADTEKRYYFTSSKGKYQKENIA